MKKERLLLWNIYGLLAWLALCLLLIAGCQDSEEPTAVPDKPAEESEANPSENSGESKGFTEAENAVDQVTISDSGGVARQSFVTLPQPIPPEDGWARSAHANSYVLDKDGHNDSCARCHSAAEWLPGPDDIPPGCLTCKFDVDIPPPLISEDDWGHISCKVCHRMDRDEPEPEFAWLDIAVIDEYIDLDSPTDLCRKCHESGEIEGHKPPVEVGEEHAELTCTACHDSHSVTVTCVNSDCHNSLLVGEDSIPGHDEDHSLVTCGACHDAGDGKPEPVSDSGEWAAFLTLSIGGEEKPVRYSSHSYVTQVACERCHFEGNSWGLSAGVAASP